MKNEFDVMAHQNVQYKMNCRIVTLPNYHNLKYIL